MAAICTGTASLVQTANPDTPRLFPRPALDALGRAVTREALQLFALAPVRRGEGKGEGSAREIVALQCPADPSP